MTTTTTEALRQTLLDAKLGGFLTWTVPDLEQTVGPCDLSPFLQHRDARAAVVQACRDKLEQYSDHEIASLAAGRSDPPDATWTEWSRYRSDAISRLTRDAPPWYAGG
ncbi:MAG: hypothetical protein LH650_15855, partial [Chloroflexi bacterium]|nr:hypothetical protein [Chloroflexota bacterium]